MSPARRSAAAAREEQGEVAVQLAQELQDRIARERQTVRALKDHLLTAAQPATPAEEPERVHAPSRTAPAAVGQDGWLPLGECLCWRSDTGEDGLLLELAGEVDMSGALRLRTLVADLLQGRPPRLLLDLGQVSFMDSNGLSALLWVRRQAISSGSGLTVTQVHPQLLRLLHVTRLDGILLQQG